MSSAAVREFASRSRRDPHLAVVSLTFTPMMCARLARAATAGEGKPVLRLAGRGLREPRAALRTLAHLGCSTARRMTLLVAIGTLILTVILYVFIPKGFFPPQDTGLTRALRRRRSRCPSRPWRKRQQALAAVLLKDPAGRVCPRFIGVDGVTPTLNSGRLLINMVPKSARTLDATG